MASKFVDFLVLIIQFPMVCHFHTQFGDKYVTYYLISVGLTLWDFHLVSLSQKPAESFLRFMETPGRVVKIFKQKLRARVQAAIMMVKMKIEMKFQQQKKIQAEY